MSVASVALTLTRVAKALRIRALTSSGNSSVACSLLRLRRCSSSVMTTAGRPSAAASPGTSVVTRSLVISTFWRALPV